MTNTARVNPTSVPTTGIKPRSSNCLGASSRQQSSNTRYRERKELMAERSASATLLAEAEAFLRRLDDIMAPVNTIQEDHALSKLPVAEYAAFDSSSLDSTVDDDEFGCLPGTRKDLLKQIMHWGLSAQSTECIYWLNGMAGTGKSTISRTRGEGDRGNAKKLFTTVVRQLVHHLPDMIPRVKQQIEKEFNISTGLLQDQFKKLLVDPLNDVKDVRKDSMRIAVIVIDALDECDGQNDVRRIISLLPAVQNIKTVRVKIFLTSRPEHPIQPSFRLMSTDSHKDFVLHEIESAWTDPRRKFHPIRLPGEANLQALAAISCPLFISAATFCRFIDTIQFKPEKRLMELLQGQKKYASRMGKTYLPILDQLVAGADFEESVQILQEFQDIVGVIILLETPLSLRSLSTLICLPGKLVSEMEEAIETRLKLLHSVVSIPDNPLHPIRPLHLSFRDFLVDPSQTERHQFWVDEQEMHGRIANHCIRVMECLKRNICNLPDYAVERGDIGTSLIKNHIQPDLEYACRFWVHHIVQTKTGSHRLKSIISFLSIHYLHWLEALSLLESTSDAVEMLDALKSCSQSELSLEDATFLEETKRFALRNIQMIESNPLQMYCSSLLFAPTESVIKKRFAKEIPTWISSVRDPVQCWSPEIQTLEGHSWTIVSMVFSSDGELLASACDQQILVWKAKTGALRYRLEARKGGFSTLDFSLNNLLASGSRDGKLSIWDATTGTLQHLIQLYRAVSTIRFSLDGLSVAAGFDDGKVIICDAVTGSIKHSTPHSACVYEVAFSPNGKSLVSCSGDRTMGLRDTQTANLLHSFHRHTGQVLSAAFSPDGSLIVSGSSDNTVRIWDSRTGSLIHTLKGHSGIVREVVFFPTNTLVARGTLMYSLGGHSSAIIQLAVSPSGEQLLSASLDGTAKLWDSRTGRLQTTLQGHTGPVFAVGFSPAGRLMATGSDDKSVKLWDSSILTAEDEHHTRVSHNGKITALSFSADGAFAASSDETHLITLRSFNLWDTAVAPRCVVFSSDSRWAFSSNALQPLIEVWSTETGTLKSTLVGHSGGVPALEISVNGKLLASGSNDATVKIWDASTGALQATLIHNDEVIAVAISPDSILVAASSARQITIWDIAANSAVHCLEVEQTPYTLRFSIGGQYLCTTFASFEVTPLYKGRFYPNLNMAVDGRWIIRGYRSVKNIIWIPIGDLRLAVHGNMIILGSETGGVCLLRSNDPVD
ncbi:hypothetical protein BJX65DRAFT_320422 [Aspergillus insuetus]